MDVLLPLLIVVPTLGFMISVLWPGSKESSHARIAFITSGFQQVIAVFLIISWILSDFQVINIKEFVIYHSVDFEFFIDLYFDKISAVFVLVGAVLTFLISVYSRHYLHKEEGFKRYFNTILFFFLGYNLIVISGNFETFFIGWEILGVSSFLLIGFYRERYLPVRNAFKVYSIYRISDIALILAMWMGHHLWGHNVTFQQMSLETTDFILDSNQESLALFIAFMILLSALVKSAQLPFSSWLPRAMEGPTPSSAIFYSSLAVHIGVFLLLRTYTFWEQLTVFRWTVGVIGLLTSIVATLTGNVQSTVKSQIAYSSIAQIGLIFIEIALGFQVLALIHFTSNAFLRSYQVLVSPSMVTYLIRKQFYTELPSPEKKIGFWGKIFNSFYVLSVKEWNLDTYQFKFLWRPVKRLGERLSIFNKVWALGVILILLTTLNLWKYEASQWKDALPYFSAILAVLMSLFAFVERKQPNRSLVLVLMSHLSIVLILGIHSAQNLNAVLIYLSGILPSAFIGWWVLHRLGKLEGSLELNRHYGYVVNHKILGFMFLMASLGLAAFPVSPTFLGVDLIFSRIQGHQIILLVLISFNFIISGIAILRIYNRVFLGTYLKGNNPMTYRSA